MCTPVVHAACSANSACCVHCQQYTMRAVPTMYAACSANSTRTLRSLSTVHPACSADSTRYVQCQQYTLRGSPTVHACVQCQQCTLRAVPTVHAACSDWYFCNRRMKLKLRICRQSFRKCFAKLQ